MLQLLVQIFCKAKTLLWHQILIFLVLQRSYRLQWNVTAQRQMKKNLQIRNSLTHPKEFWRQNLQITTMKITNFKISFRRRQNLRHLQQRRILQRGFFRPRNDRLSTSHKNNRPNNHSTSNSQAKKVLEREFWVLQQLPNNLQQLWVFLAMQFL